MVWGKSSDRDEQRARGDALTAAYKGPAGMPVYDRAAQRGGSRGCAPIWVMREAWMPRVGSERKNRPCSCPDDPMCIKHGFDRQRRGLLVKREAERGKWSPETEKQIADKADPDGFAVFGRYPHGFLDHVLKMHLLGEVRRDRILHVCSGTLSDTEAWTVDLRSEARPRVQASGTKLPFRDASFPAVMMDPPYSDEYARNLYKVENPRPSWLLKEAARVVVPGGRVGILHVAIPFSPPGCRLVNVWGISTGVGFRIRALTVYEREQDELAFTVAPAPPQGTSLAARSRWGAVSQTREGM